MEAEPHAAVRMVPIVPHSWRRTGAAIVSVAAIVVSAPAFADAPFRHAIAMHGEPALPEGFSHFRYANPAAPKGGRLVQGVLGTFDNLNSFIVKGLPPAAMRAPLVGG